LINKKFLKIIYLKLKSFLTTDYRSKVWGQCFLAKIYIARKLLLFKIVIF